MALVQITNPAAKHLLPCSNCKSKCCMSIKVNAAELQKIFDYMATLPDEYVERLRGQDRPQGMCIFVDTANWSCSVHPVRPEVCRLFGYTPSMLCPYAPEVGNQIAVIDALTELAKTFAAGVETYHVGVTFTWDNVGVHKD